MESHLISWQANTYMTNNKHKAQTLHINSRGFSLIELTVVLSIFLVIMGSMIGVLISMASHQKKILAEQELFSQSNFALEYISQSLKMAVADPDGSCLGQKGNVYLLTHCTDSGTGQEAKACNGVKFINSLDSNACVELFLDTSTNPAHPLLRQVKNDALAQNLLSDVLKVPYARFIINGDKALRAAASGDKVKPTITMALNVSVPGGRSLQERIMQVTVSQRATR